MTAPAKALARLWTDRCSLYIQVKTTDPGTNITRFSEQPLAEDLPCRLSFKSLSAARAGPAAAVSQQTVLFLAPQPAIPAGCRIVVRRGGDPARELVFGRSGLPGIYSHHQEVPLEPFRGYA